MEPRISPVSVKFIVKNYNIIPWSNVDGFLNNIQTFNKVHSRPFTYIVIE